MATIVQRHCLRYVSLTMIEHTKYRYLNALSDNNLLSRYIQRGYFDHSHFFRVVEHFLVQFGIGYTQDEELKVSSVRSNAKLLFLTHK